MFSGKESEWTWNTSSGLSVSYGLVGGTGAQFVLNDPRGGTASFNYITVGVGASVGAKWSFGGSSTAMYSKGKVFISDSFPGNEFHNRDFEGFCLVADASAGVIAGVSVDTMLLGIPAADVPKSILTDFGVGLPITAMATRGRSLLDDHPVLGVLGGISAYLETEAVSRVFANGTVADFFKSNAKALLLTNSASLGRQYGGGALASVGYVWIGALDTPPKIVENLLRVPVDPYHKIVATTREMIPFPADVLFDFDKYDIKPDAELALWGLAHKIQQRGPGKIVIEGHTDGLGKDAYNYWLSKQRADAVARWLIIRRIVKLTNITTKGLGHSQPAFPDKLNGQDNPEGRMRNRRIEVRFLWY
jgi:outer membrane protein OmpA-like peptidoglycan-associated protein